MYHRSYMQRGNAVGTGILAFLAGAVTWALFGSRIKEKMNQSREFQDLKRQVYDRASRISDITQDKYNEIVDEVSNKYAQAKGISKNELADLAEDLKWHWGRIKASWSSNRYSNKDVRDDIDQSINNL